MELRRLPPAQLAFLSVRPASGEDASASLGVSALVVGGSYILAEV